MKLAVRGVSIAVLLLVVNAAPAAAQGLLYDVVKAPDATLRDCAAPGAARSGVVSRNVTAPANGWVNARLNGADGDWDLAVFERASGRLVASSSSFGNDEVAQGIAAKGSRLSVRACRVRGLGQRAELHVTFDRLAGKGETASLVKVNTPSEDRKRELTKLGLDLTEHGGRNFVAVVLHGKEDAAKLRDNKFSYEVQVKDLAKKDVAERAADARFARRVRASALPSGRNGYRRLGDYGNDLKKLVRENPGLVKPITLPHKTWEGRTVEGVEITTDVDRRDGKPVFLQLGMHHAREWPSAEHTMEWAFEIVNAYKRGDARARRLVSRTRTIVVPLVNPDGFNISREAGAAQGADGGRGAPPASGDPVLGPEETNIVSHPYEYRRKNCRLPEGEGGSCLQPALGLAALGVDPNRNYGAFWGGPGASGDPTNETYWGPAAFSEPETKNVRHIVSTRHVTTLITNHTFSDLILRAPGIKAQGLAPDEPQMKALGDSMAQENGYLSLYGWQLYDTTGTTEDWSYSATGGYGYTFEIGCEQLDRATNECDLGHFHPPFAKVVAEWEGTTPQSNQLGKDGGGNREAYYKAMENTADARHHSTLEGRGAAGLILRLKKGFDTPTSQDANEDGKPDTFRDELNTTYEVPTSGNVNWSINPSTRPLVAKDKGRAPTGRPSPRQTISNNTPPVPACPGYHNGAALPGCFRDHPITIPTGPGVDNGSATVRVEWASPASDYDVEVYQDKNANGTLEEEEIEGTSGLGTTDFEQVTLGPDPRGTYVLRVVNYAATEPYDIDVTYASPTLTKAQVESWALSCETHSGRVLTTAQIQVARGQSVSPQVGACLAALERSCARGAGDTPTGRVRGTVLDRVRLGRSRTANLRAYRFSRRRRGSVDRFCLSDRRYVRVGYPSAKLRRGFGRTFRRRYTSTKGVLALTTSTRYRIRKVRVGSSSRTLRKRIGRVRGIRVGANVWYLKRGSKAMLVFKVRRGKVLELGIADKRLTTGRKRAKRFLSSFN